VTHHPFHIDPSSPTLTLRMRLNIRTASLRTANLLLVSGLLALSGCRPVYEFTVVQDNNSVILARITKLLSAEGFKPISQFSPDPRTNDCRVIDEDGAFEKQTHAESKNRWFSVTYLVCDGHLRVDLHSSDTDTYHDRYQRKLVDLLRHELDGEIAAGQVIVKTKHDVALGP
jgi:hypothetical protein